MKKRIVALFMAMTLIAGVTINNIGDLEQVEASQSVTEVSSNMPESSRQYLSVPDVTVVGKDDMEFESPFFADMIKLPDGTLLIAYDDLPGHALWDKDEEYGKIKLVRSTNNGKTWSEPQTVVTKEKMLDWGIGSPERPLLGANGMFTLLDDGTLLMFFVTSYIYTEIIPKDDYKLYVMASEDNGLTWKDPVLVPSPNNDPNLGQSKQGDAIQLRDGSVLIPSYTIEGETLNPYFDTWAKRGTYDKETNTWTWEKDIMICSTPDGEPLEFNYVDEAAFVTHEEDGVEYIYTLIRNNGRVLVSSDRGDTWTPIAMEKLDESIELPNDQVLLCQPDFSKHTDPEGNTRIYVSYSLGHTRYGRPIYGKFFTPDPTKEDHGWGDTTAEMLYHSPSSTVELGDPASEYVVDENGNEKIFLICYDGDTKSIPGMYINLPEDNAVVKDVYTDLTIEDFGISTIQKFEGVQGAYIQSTTPNETLDGKAIVGTYNLSTSPGDRVVFGGSWSGITLGTSTNGNLIVSYYDEQNPGKTNDSTSELYNPKQFTITPNQVDGQNLYGRDIKIEVTFKFQNVDTANNSADVLFGITINDIYTTHMVFTNMNMTFLKQCIGIHAAAGTPTVLTSTAYANFEKINLSDFGITSLEMRNDVPATTIKNNFKIGDGTGTLDGKSLTGIYNFSKTGSTSVVFGKYNSDFPGFQISFSGETLMVWYVHESWVASNTGITYIQPYELDPSYTSLTGRDLKIEMLFDLVEQADGTTDLTYTIMINDKLTRTNTVEEVDPSLLQEAITIRNSDISNAKIADVGYYNAEVLTLKDFGIDGAMVLNPDTCKATDTPTASLDGKIVKGIYKFNANAELVYGSNTWRTGTVVLQQYDTFLIVWNGFNPMGYIYPSDLGGKNIVGSELEIEAYFNVRGNANGGQDLEVYLTIDKQYQFKYTYTNADVTYLNEAICASAQGASFTVIEPSAYPNYRLPQAMGATLATVATNKDAVRMGFSFADVIKNEGIAQGDIAEYGAVLVAGTKDAATMKEKAASMIANNQLDIDGYKRTQGDIEKLWASESKEYFVTISNSADEANMHIRATAIAYIKLTDGTIYYSSDCNSDQTQRHNKSVFGLLKAIFTELYVKDYDDAADGTEADTPLGKAITKYNADKEEAEKINIGTIRDIINSTEKSTEVERKTLIAVHYAM